MILQVQVDDGIAPVRATAGAGGFDLFAAPDPALIEAAYLSKRDFAVAVPAGGFAEIRTGIRVQIPEGWVGLVRSRSGLAFRHRIFAFHGTIDADYRGEIVVLLENRGKEPFLVEPGMRIAQLVVVPCATEAAIVPVLDPSARGSRGFGSTGS
ncbi:MAG: dUTP diphosphatase [Elioraea sp.]|nr:dUTP diphosphatase [Elioraea sp.]